MTSDAVPTLFRSAKSGWTNTRRPTRRSAGPFVLVGALGLASVALPPYANPQPWEAMLLLGGFILVLAFLAVSLRRAERSWVDPMPAFLFFGLVAVAREAAGGSISGVEALVALPIVWLAITGTRRDLTIATVLTAGVFLLPMALIGPPDYPENDWRSAVLWIGLAGLVAPVVRGFVVELAEQRQANVETNAAMEAILRASDHTSMVACDLEGTVLSFSNGAEDLLGYRAEEVVG
ncbi:MAG: hypothetical protein WA892_00555, partial [Ornithinimicrobium sp.]